MMLGESSTHVLGSSGGDMEVAAITGQETAGHVIGSNSGENYCRSRGEDDDRNYCGGGNRWPRQETLALLKIRSDMDAAFRYSSHKGPLWEEISRKMGEVGYDRSGKKCKEKFENMYKYHRRTKDGRSGKSEGKTYRFFEELEAFENIVHTDTDTGTSTSPPKPQTPLQTITTSPNNHNHNSRPFIINPTQTSQTVPATSWDAINPVSVPITSHIISHPHFSTNSTSSSTGSEEGLKKRKYWKVFFRRLTKKVIEKQEKLQKQFLETIERRDKAREEAWRIQQMARIGQEYQNILIQQERSKQDITTSTSTTHQAAQLLNGNGNQKPSPSRWPKAEILALIHLRTNMDNKYQEKAPLWEDISAAMGRLGYNRNAKRCKEKWENINKYFKKVKETNKKRPDDSKTCPYFHQLDAIYREKSRPLMVQYSPPQNVFHHDDDDGESDEDEVGFQIVATKAAAQLGDAS